jgi:hypothetical protein
MVAILNIAAIYWVILTLENVGTVVNYHGIFIASAQEPYSRHFIAFVNYEWAQKVSVCSCQAYPVKSKVCG